MRQSLFKQRPRQRVRSQRRKRLLPPYRTNPLTDHTVSLYEIGTGGKFKATPNRNADWKQVYGEVLKIIAAVRNGGSKLGQLKDYINDNANYVDTADGKQRFLPSVYTVALWFGFVTTRDSNSIDDRVFQSPDQYYTHAIAYLIGLAANDNAFIGPTNNLITAGMGGDAFAANFSGQDYNAFVINEWQSIWDASDSALNPDPNIPITMKIERYISTLLDTNPQFVTSSESSDNRQYLSKNKTFLSPQYQSGASRTRQRGTRSQGAQQKGSTSQTSAIQKEALRQAANARIDRFMATYGKSKKRIDEMKPFAFNIFYNGRTGNIPTVQEWTIPGDDFDSITGSEGAAQGTSYPITQLLQEIEKNTRQKRNAIIVYARSNGNAQVFITSASPASNLGRKHTRSGEFYVPIIEMTSFPQAAAMLASGLILADGTYRYTGEGTGYDKEFFPCCAPHTGFGQALVFARRWRSSKLRYKNMDILVYQEVNGRPQWMGYDPGTGATQYSYNAENVWDTYQREFDVAKTARIITQQGDNEFWKNQDAPNFTSFVEKDEEVQPTETTQVAQEEITTPAPSPSPSEGSADGGLSFTPDEDLLVDLGLD